MTNRNLRDRDRPDPDTPEAQPTPKTGVPRQEPLSVDPDEMMTDALRDAAESDPNYIQPQRGPELNATRVVPEPVPDVEVEASPSDRRGQRAATVREVMTPDPITVPEHASVLDVARRMAEGSVGNVIVTREGSPVGIVTDRDIVVRMVTTNQVPDAVKIGDICTRDPQSVMPDDSVRLVMDLMRDSAIRRVLVLDGAEPVGVVSLGDLAATREPGSVLGQLSAAAPNG